MSETEYKMNKGRAMRAAIEGNFNIHDFINEAVDNFDHGNATEFHIRALPVKTKNKDSHHSPIDAIVVADNGVMPMCLEKDLEWGVDNNHPPNNIGDFGVGIKAAAMSVAKTADFIVRDHDGNISFSRIERDKLYQTNPTYISPSDPVPAGVDPKALWDKYAVDSSGTGTMVIIRNITETDYSTCNGLIQGIRLDSPGRVAVRYSKLMKMKCLTIKTAVNGGELSEVEYSDVLGEGIPGSQTLLNDIGYYSKKACSFKYKLVRVPPGTPGASHKGGIYVQVCNIIMYLDRNRWLGMYRDGDSHSYRWQCRGLISFDTKDEFKKVLGFTAHKNTISYDYAPFGDWLRDTKDLFGKAIEAEVKNEKLRQEQERTADLNANSAKEVETLIKNLQNRTTYGSDLALQNFSTLIKGFKKRDVNIKKLSNSKTAKFNRSTGIIEWNPYNPQMSKSLNVSSTTPRERFTARAIAVADAIVSDLERDKREVSRAAYSTLLKNLIWSDLT
jgi:hypothetical protein